METSQEKKLNELLINAVSVCNHREMIEYFREAYTKRVYLTGSMKEPKFNIWDSESKIYISHSIVSFGEIIIDTILIELSKVKTKLMERLSELGVRADEFEKMKLASHLSKIGKAIKFVGTGDTIQFIKKYLAKREQDFDEVIFDIQAGHIQYQNGKLNLRTGLLEQRTEGDYVSQCLDYDYEECVDKQLLDFVEGNFTKMFNNNKSDYEKGMSWIAYTMTGENNLQKFMNMYGPMAGNSKTAIFKILTRVFKMYVLELEQDVLEKGNKDKFRDINNLDTFIRCAYIEEMPEVKIDECFLKKFVGDESMQVKELYNTRKKHVVLRVVLSILTNEMFHFRPEEAIRRRGLKIEMKTRFVDSESQIINSDCFLRDKEFHKTFDEVKYKNAFTTVLIKFFKQFYQQGDVIGAKEMNDAFRDFCEINDSFKEFMDKYFEITLDTNDKVNKDTFIELYSRHTGKKKEFKYVLGVIRKYGITYDKNNQFKAVRGVLYGIKEKKRNDDEYIECNGLDAGVEPIPKQISEEEEKALLVKLLAKYPQQQQQQQQLIVPNIETIHIETIEERFNRSFKELTDAIEENKKIIQSLRQKPKKTEAPKKHKKAHGVIIDVPQDDEALIMDFLA